MNGVIYARYSSEKQKEESIEGQLRECKAFAKRNDIQIADTFIDRALSAKTDNRPSFQKMIKDSTKKSFDVIIVWKLDRFARNRYDSAHYKSVLRKNGVKVVSATKRFPKALKVLFNLAGIRTARNGKLDTDNITSMLHNRKYIGEYRYRDIVIPGGIPAIVPEELFNRAQERMAANKKAPAKHKAEDEYLLTTKLYCGKCKCFMVGESGTGRSGQAHRYYKCVSAKHKKGCDKKSVKKEWIENIIIDQIQSIILDDELIERLADMALERQGIFIFDEFKSRDSPF